MSIRSHSINSGFRRLIPAVLQPIRHFVNHISSPVKPAGFMFILLMTVFFVLSGHGQPPPPLPPDLGAELPPVPEEEYDAPRKRMADLLDSLFEAIQIKERQYERLRSEWRQAETDHEREHKRESMEDTADELRELRWRFQETAAGIDLTLFEEVEERVFSWEQKLGEILEPILSELESVTEESRRIASLRGEVEHFSKREKTALRAIANIEGWMEMTDNEALLAAYEELLARWEERADFAANRAQMARLQLENLEQRERGIVDGTADFVRGFIQQRGLNLFLGIMAALTVFFAVRFITYLIRRTFGNRNPKKLSGRIFILTTNLLAIIGSLLAMMVVFSAAGDLFLFAVVVLFLLGASWAGIKLLPQFIESLKLILNIGMVRENERLIFDGIPWNVQSLGFRSMLYNERLDRGTQFLPVRELVGLHSRPWCDGEEPFPCRRGDWVQLNDNRIGEVVSQNPGHVTLREYGGATTTYQTLDFLARTPRLLSAETFRITTAFGVDYRHLQECTDKIPAVMKEKLEKELIETAGEGALKQVLVYFTEAGSSSLNYQAQAVFSREAAPLYEILHYNMQKILVETCNQNGWQIPFQQITIHQAE